MRPRKRLLLSLGRQSLSLVLLGLVLVGHLQIYVAMSAAVALTECSVITPDEERAAPSRLTPPADRRTPPPRGEEASDSRAVRGSRAIWGGNAGQPIKPAASPKMLPIAGQAAQANKSD